MSNQNQKVSKNQKADPLGKFFSSLILVGLPSEVSLWVLHTLTNSLGIENLGLSLEKWSETRNAEKLLAHDDLPVCCPPQIVVDRICVLTDFFFIAFLMDVYHILHLFKDRRCSLMHYHVIKCKV
jgi:hypothetical protein